MQRTRRDDELPQVLSLRVKTVPPMQGWSPCGPGGNWGLRVCNRRVLALVDEGLVEVARGWAGVVAEPEGPLATWSPGAPTPDLANARSHSSARWSTALKRMRSVRHLRVTASGAARVGGVVTPVRPSELSHDLLLTGAYLATLRRYPNVAARWENERISGRYGRGARGCDALIRLPGRPVAVEVIGESYTHDHLVDLHAMCEEMDWRYQLW